LSLAAVILAGGASRRMGEDKASQIWNGQRAVDIAASCARDAGAAFVMTAGADHGLPFVLDPSPQAGPVAGVIAALPRLRAQGADRMLLLAVDAPLLRPGDLRVLAAASGAGAVYAGFPLPAALRLDAIPVDAENDWPLRRLVERAGATTLPCPEALAQRLKGANTPQDREALMARWANLQD